MEAVNESLLRLDVTHVSPFSCTATVVIPAAITDSIHQYALSSQQRTVQTAGFAKGKVPLEYIAQNFSSSIAGYLKEFLFNYFVISFLHKELRGRKILVAGDPRLTSIHVQPHQNALFEFQVSTFPPLDVQEWKHLPFKAPKRKKYKDLDRQVDSFLKDEFESAQKHTNSTAQIGDLICFEITLAHEDGNPVVHHTETIWFKMGDEEADGPLRELFIDKKVGDRFYSANKNLHNYFSDQMDIETTHCITILDILHHAYFCLDQFKRFFKLKTNKEAYQKLIEVFSYRNDLSQRRSMAEEALKLLLSKHKFEVPNHVLLRQQEKVIARVQSNPDYHVYRVQKDFEKRIKQLAEKQIKERLLLDQIAYYENIAISHDDVKQYLNLTNRPRTKEFIYFDVPQTRLRGQESPITAQELMQASLREKTVNYIIYHLTRA